MKEEHVITITRGDNTPIFRAIEFKYFGPTTYRGSYIKVYDRWFKKTHKIQWSYKYSNMRWYVEDYLLGQGFDIQGYVPGDEIGTLLCSWDSEKQIGSKK